MFANRPQRSPVHSEADGGESLPARPLPTRPDAPIEYIVHRVLKSMESIGDFSKSPFLVGIPEASEVLKRIGVIMLDDTRDEIDLRIVAYTYVTNGNAHFIRREDRTSLPVLIDKLQATIAAMRSPDPDLAREMKSDDAARANIPEEIFCLTDLNLGLGLRGPAVVKAYRESGALIQDHVHFVAFSDDGRAAEEFAPVGVAGVIPKLFDVKSELVALAKLAAPMLGVALANT
jgi:hypothetical protein